jgi:hypothetical protein
VTRPETMAWTYGEPAAPPPGRDQRVARLIGACVLVGAVLAPFAAWAWVRLADPPTVRLASNRGLYLGEQALNQQSGVTVWFLLVGAGFGAVAGLAVGRFGQRFGWPVVVAVLVLCAVGSLGTRYLGVHAFGADPRAAAAHAAVGTRIRLGVGLDTWVAYLGWPIGGIVGALGAIAGWSRAEMPPNTPPSPTLESAS